MKPVGLVDPRNGREPYAAVQLRQENLMADAYSMVGFQNHLRYGEQARVLRLIPGLEHAEFLQFGQIHRNTYLNAPRVLAPTMQMLRFQPFLCRTNHRRRRLRRIGGDGLAGGKQRRAILEWQRTFGRATA